MGLGNSILIGQHSSVQLCIDFKVLKLGLYGIVTQHIRQNFCYLRPIGSQ